MNRLAEVLTGCLDPRTVRQSEQRLKQLGEQPDFTEQLLRLIPGQQPHLLTMTLSTLKNYLTQRYNANEGAVPPNQKELLRQSIFDMYYELKHLPTAVELYKQIVNVVAIVDYPWRGIEEQLTEDLSTRIEAGVYVSRQIVKVFEYFQNNQRQPLEQFINVFFPMLQNVVEQILSNFNQETSKLLEVILKTFYCSFHISIPHYLRDYKNVERWMVFFSCIMGTQTSSLSSKSQTMIARIYIRLFSVYCNDAQDGKNFHNWAQRFRQNYAAKLHEHIYQLVCSRVGDEETLANLINCLHEVIKQEHLRGLMTDEQVQNLFYRGTLFSLCESSKDELQLFSRDELQYVRRKEDLTCYPVRRAMLDLIAMAAATLTFNNKQEVMRIVQYCASILSGPNREGQKEVAIRILMTIGRIILKHQYFKQEFENLIVTYFLPVLSHPNQLLNALICELLSMFLPFGSLSSETVSSLMERIYGKIIDQQSLVVRYNAILAFTALLDHKAALQAVRPHFQVILQIYVKTLNTFDHQNLLKCLETIVKYFDHEIINFAPDLINHLLRMFCSLAKVDQQEDEDEPDGNSPASAALSTVKQILDSELAPQTYFNASNDLIDLLRGILNQYNSFFDEVLSLFAVFTYRAKEISDYEYPYVVCRRLLEGKDFDLGRSGLNSELLNEIAKVEKSDSEYEQSLLAILKNIIQKGPNQMLRNYSWPTHPQLILGLIENQRIPAQQLGSLNTSQVNQIWSPYLSAYSAILYGIGSLCHPREVKAIIGVSLFPWLKDGVTPELVKIIIDSVDKQNEDDDDDLYQENTAQLLQKYAQQDDDDDEEQFYENSGDNYGFLYDSPFDSSKDREMMINLIKALPQDAAINLVNSLSLQYRKKLQIVMSSQ